MDIYVQTNGQQHGPFSDAQIRTGIDRGEFKPDDLAWTNGKASWQRLATLINLDLNQPPPLLEPVTKTTARDGSVELPTFEVPSRHQSKESSDVFMLAIEDDSISINGIPIPLPTDANPLNQFFGTPRWREQPPTYIWDDWGVTAQGKDRKSLDYFSIILREPKLLGGEHHPKEPFPGKLAIGGVSVTAETKIQDIVASKRGSQLIENSTDSWENTKRTFFGGNSPSISLYTTHQDTVSWLTFAYRSRKSR